jgi:hypothetical protein
MEIIIFQPITWIIVEGIRVQGEEVIVFNEEIGAEYSIRMLEAEELLQEYIG